MLNLYKRLTILVSLCVITPAFVSHAKDYLHEGPILLRNITVIDGLGSSPMPMRDILIEDGRINKIAVTTMIGNLPDNSRVIEGKGLTVLPGLIDLHTHISDIDYSLSNLDTGTIQSIEGIKRYHHGFHYGSRAQPEGMQRYLNANLYAGVTTIFEVGSRDLDTSIMLRDEIATGKRPGPSIYTTGPIINALKTTQDSVLELTSIATRAEIKQILDERQRVGIGAIKMYAGVTPWEARHIMVEAKKRNMRGFADFWCTNLSRDIFEITYLDGYAHGGCLEISIEDATWMAENSKYAMFTLSIFDSMAGNRVYQDYPGRGFLKNPLIVDVFGKQSVLDYYDAVPSVMEQWNHGEKAMYNVQHFGPKEGYLALNMRNLKTLYDAGVTIGIGTDAPWPPGNWPGEGMHYELELHVEAGIPPVDALKMATYNGAIIIGIADKTGSITRGKTADLLVVKGSPERNISATRNIMYVIKSGKLINRESLKY